MTNLELPLPESYWVLPGRFLAGEYPGGASEVDTRRRLTAILTAGFDTFIVLTRQDELPPYMAILAEESRSAGLVVNTRRFPIGDFGLPQHHQMVEILDSIDDFLSANHRIYLHCWGGIGRTGTTVGCYLVRHGKSGGQALQQLAEWWSSVPKSIRYPFSPETEAQRRFILSWNELA